MKIFNKIAFLFILSGLLFTACKDEGPEVYSDGDNIHFLNAASSNDESIPTPIAIPIFFSKNNPVGGSFEVQYSSDTAVEGLDYIITSPTSFTLDANEYTDTIMVQLIDNFVLEGDKVITFTIVNSSVPAGFPGPDGLNSTHEFTIVDNDCVLPLEGQYSEVTTGGAGDGSGNLGTPIDPWDYGVTLTITGVGCDGDGKYTIDDITMGMYVNYWGIAGPNPATFVVNGTSITIITEESPDIFYDDEFSGSGAVNPDGTISLSWSNGYGDQGNSVLTKL